MPSGSLLIADLGGTRARFAQARSDGPGYDAEMELNCADYASPEDAIDAYLEMSEAAAPAALCLAVAAPILGPGIRFLNRDWSLDTAGLQRRFPGARITLVNDFQAVAWALPVLGPRDIEPIGDPPPFTLDEGDFTLGIVGPGTGLGTSALIRRDGRLHALSGEGGHVGFAPETELQLEVLTVLRQRFERVSDERLLSGPGIENIHRALLQIHGQPQEERSAAEIFAAADEEEAASQARNLFFEILGQVAGNLALALGALQGIYIAGGIVGRHSQQLTAGPFRAAFENKGRHRSMMERIPTVLVRHPQPGLLGAGFLARRSMAG